jgi:hypothetical protein
MLKDFLNAFAHCNTFAQRNFKHSTLSIHQLVNKLIDQIDLIVMNLSLKHIQLRQSLVKQKTK